MNELKTPERFEQIISRLRDSLDQSNLLDQFPVLEKRLREHFPPLLDLCCSIYPGQLSADWPERLANLAVKSWLQRPPNLKILDAQRESDPLWFINPKHVGAACYVDRFSGNLKGLFDHLDYLEELGVDYLHLMPVFRTPPGNSDGGYAISSYRDIQPDLGRMEDLQRLGTELRKRGISLALDFVLNHTANDHEWALKAINNDPLYREYYFMFPDRTEPDRFEKSLREIFPTEHHGSFTWFEQCQAWVWTSFHSFQWDLNYSNPNVFLAMADEMLALANFGTEIIRLDAVAFIWKKQDTSCENLPQALQIIEAFNHLAKIASPALIFKSEAIVHPDDVTRYIQPKVCQLSYNPLLMAMLWNSLATRDISLLRVSLQRHYAIPHGTTWMNYLRCHDDIGWTFSDEDAWSLGINPNDHRYFLNDFYTGKFLGSFARGKPFQLNPKNGDSRISGTLASLAGLQKALEEETALEVDLAIQRILMLNAVIFTAGGVPLLYLGDELGQLNDESYLDNPDTCNDNRWIHRPLMDWRKAGKRFDSSTVEGRLFQGIQRLVKLRKTSLNRLGIDLKMIDVGNSAVLCYSHGPHSLFLANFSEGIQTIQFLFENDFVFNGVWKDLLIDDLFDFSKCNSLQPYQFLWLTKLDM